MHHKTSDSVEIQEKRIPENARKNWKNNLSLFSQNRTNTDEFGRNQKNKTPCFPQYEFCADGFGRVFFSGFFKNFGKSGKLQKHNGRILGIFNFFSSVQFSRQRYDAIQILVGRGTSSDLRLRFVVLSGCLCDCDCDCENRGRISEITLL